MTVASTRGLKIELNTNDDDIYIYIYIYTKTRQYGRYLYTIGVKPKISTARLTGIIAKLRDAREKNVGSRS